jgi:hypothetical protein
VTIGDVIERWGCFAHRGDLVAAAEAWEETGVQAGEVEAWLSARCFDPGAAEDLDEFDITPRMASTRTEAGNGCYLDTVAYEVAVGDLDLQEACALLGVRVAAVDDEREH